MLGYSPGKPPGGLGAMVSGAPGLVGCALASQDAQAVYQQAQQQGMSVEAPLHFSRPVVLPEGTQEAAFSITRFAPGTLPGLEAFVCQHHTPALVWRAEWMHHPNGALGIQAISVVVADPQGAIHHYQRLLGGDAVPIPGGVSVIAKVAFNLITAATLAEQTAGLGGASTTGMLSLRVADPQATADYLQRQGIAYQWQDHRVLISPQLSGGTLLSFSH